MCTFFFSCKISLNMNITFFSKYEYHDLFVVGLSMDIGLPPWFKCDLIASIRYNQTYLSIYRKVY